jgi:hypothetical protein
MEFSLSEQKLTLKEFEKFKKDYNLILPKVYESLMIEHNGGIPERRYFKGGTVYFESIKYGEYPLENIIKNLENILPKGAFPFADYSGQSLCISLNDTDYGAIYFFDETGDYDKVCDSFEQFMEELSEDSDY